MENLRKIILEEKENIKNQLFRFIKELRDKKNKGINSISEYMDDLNHIQNKFYSLLSDFNNNIKQFTEKDNLLNHTADEELQLLYSICRSIIEFVDIEFKGIKFFDKYSKSLIINIPDEILNNMINNAYLYNNATEGIIFEKDFKFNISREIEFFENHINIPCSFIKHIRPFIVKM